MQPRTQQDDSRNRLVMLVSIVLALLVTIFCIVDIIVVRRWLAARRATEQPQVVQPATALPKSIPTVGPTVMFVPTEAPPPTTEPPVIVTPPPSVWRFLSINPEDVGTFENVADPSQRLLAVCIDKGRPPPEKGEIYVLNDEGVLKLEDGTKRYQRFRVTGGQ